MIKRKIFITAIFFLIVTFGFTTTVHALGEGPSQPEAMQFEPVDATDLVNLATGDFAYNLPLIVIPGPAGDYPINMSYHAGIGPNQEATWVGLGWTLNPGAINRTVNGYPDDYLADLVKSHNEMEELSGYNIGIGISFNIGYGSVGLNMSYDSFNSNFGVNFNAGMAVGPISASAGTEGFDLGVSRGFGPISSKAGISITSEGINPSLSGKISAPVNTSIGFSLSSQGGFRSNFQMLGYGASSMSTVGFGTTWSRSNGIRIPILSFITIDIAASEWGWFLDETYFDTSYGYLYQASYLTDTTGPRVLYGRDFNKKYERMAVGQYLHSSQDIYLVATQGLNGVFKPFLKNMFHLEDDLNLEDDVVSEHKSQLKTISGVSMNTLQDTVFRFLGDPGANLTTTGLSDPILSQYDFRNIYQDRFGSQIIQPEFDSFNHKITGFSIVKADGTRYEFIQPVMNWLDYSWSNEKVTQHSGDQRVENTLSSNRILGTPYASNWLLTAIKGPDYVDRDQNGKANDGDWGYWVKFTYRKGSRPQIWRSPYQGMGPGSTSTKIENASIGLRDMVLLERIETASNIAVFRKSERKDRKTPVIQEEVSLPGKLDSKISNDQTGTTTYVYRFPGDWRNEYENLAYDKVFLVLTFVSPVSDFEIYGGKCRLNKELSATCTSTTPSIDWTVDYNGYDTIFTINIHNDVWRDGVYEAEFLIQHFFQNSYSDAQKLYQIDLFSKEDPYVRYNQQEQEWFIDSQNSTILKSVRFDYDYSLCAKTPSSQALQSDGARGGKLTLKSVFFLGKDATDGGIPPYQFIYANGDLPLTGMNPTYHEHDWDNWGSYRDPENDRGKYKHLTPQEESRADLAAAWSLTEIRTPTGGSIHISYESDDYYNVSDHIDFTKFNLAFDTTVSEELKPHQAIPLILENTILWQTGSLISSRGNLSQNRQQFLRDFGLKPERHIAIIETTGTSTGFGWPQRIIVRQIEEIREFFVDQVFFGFRIKFSGEEPFAFDIYDTSKRYYLLFYPRKNFGGGIRVRSVELHDGPEIYKTIYNYATEDGFSTGVTASLPSHYGEAKYLFRALEDKWENTRYYIHENPLLSAPNVIYSYVEVLNINERGKILNGKTVFEFVTAKDYPFYSKILHRRGIGYRNSFRRGAHYIRLIDDRSGVCGLPKATTYYENYEIIENQITRKVRKEETSYAFSDSLDQHGQVLMENDVLVPGSHSPLGIIHERYSFANDWKHVSHPDREEGILFTNGDVVRLYQNAYPTVNQVTNYNYDTGDTSEPSGISTFYSTNFVWDSLSGLVIGTAKDRSDQRPIINKIVPAYWRYPGMKNKNMLTQTAQETVYWGGTDSLTDQGLLNHQYNFSPDDIVSSNVTTWKIWGENVWRKNDLYVYNKEIDRANGSGYSPFNDWNYSSANYPAVAANQPWQMTSNITGYDAYSHPVEESHIDKTYTSTIYNYNGAVPIAIAKNAQLNEIYYLNFETEKGLNTLGTVSTYFTDKGERRTGQKAFKAFARDMPWYNLTGLKKQNIYRVSFWAKKGTAETAHSIRFYFSGPGMGGGWQVLKTLQTADQWEYFEFQLIPLNNGNIEMHVGSDNILGTGGKFHYIDDLRIYPLDGTMRTFSYYPLTLQLASITDKNSIYSYFDYDKLGRLIHVWDQDKNLLKRYQYHYGANP